MQSTVGMAEDALVRRENLKRLIKDRGWVLAELEEKLGGGRYSFWRDVLADNSKKSFGEKVARRVEECASLPRGWLDRSDAPMVKAKKVDFTENKMTPVEAAFLEDYRLLPQKEQVAFAKQLHEKVAVWKEYKDEIIRGMKMGPSTPAAPIEREQYRNAPGAKKTPPKRGEK